MEERAINIARQEALIKEEKEIRKQRYEDKR